MYSTIGSPMKGKLMNITTTRMNSFTSALVAGLICAVPLRSAGQGTADRAGNGGRVASGATFTRITTGAIATDAAHSFGCAWSDYDGDGYLDLMVGNGLGDANALYHNEGNGTFTRVTTGAIATTVGDAGGVVWGDYDNDGDFDLFVANWRLPSFLFRNDGNGNFTRVINGAMGGNSADSNGAAWGDYDNDGFLDLVVANGGAQNEYLYRNNGNESFTQILTGPIPTSGMSSGLPLWSDYDNDRKLDLAVSSNDPNGWSLLFHNEGSGVFTRVTPGPWAGTGESGTDWGDLDNDGDLDLVGYSWNGGADISVVIFRNELDGQFSPLTVATFIRAEFSPVNIICGDYDNDGWLDLFCATYRRNTAQNDLLFRNNGDGTFTRITGGAIINTTSRGSIGAAWCDYDNDGFLDILTVNGGEEGADADFLFHNDGNSNRWLHVNCVGAAANRSSIGARVRVQAVIGGVQRSLLREVSSGSGYNGSGLRVHFGLGDATNIDVLRVEWPSGTVKEWRNVAVNQILTLKEPPVLSVVGMDGLGSFQLSITGRRGQIYALDYSTNLIHWIELTDFTATNRLTPVKDPGAAAAKSRFYRAREAD